MSYVILLVVCLQCFACILGFSPVAHTENETEYEQLIPDEQRLYQEIMEGYEIAVRPCSLHSDMVIVKFGLRLDQIIDLDERHQVLTTNVFIDQIWEDPSLAWDPSRFNNVSSIRIPSTKVWLPDTFIYNNADGGSTGFVDGKYVLVRHDGSVLWPVPVKLRSSCQVEIKYFPFDDQECILRFGSWIYNGDALTFVPLKDDSPIDMSAYVKNSEWDLLSASLVRNKRQESCCVEPHTDLVYRLQIRRRTFFYVFNVIIPCVMLSVLTLLTFWVPATSGEKVTLGLSVFLAFSMFMLLIAEEVPASSDSVPLIGIYLCCVMTMTSFSVLMAVLIINLYGRGVRSPRAPNWLRVLCLNFMSTIFRITHDIKTIAETITLDEEQNDLENKRRSPRRKKTAQQKSESNNLGLHRVEVHPRKFHRTSVDHRTGWLEYGYDSRITEETNDDDGSFDTCQPSTSNSNIALDNRSSCNNDQPNNRYISETEASDSEDPVDTHVTKGYGNGHQSDKNDAVSKEEGQSLLKESEKEEEKKSTSSTIFEKKVAIVEWQRIALVIDRLLFWIFFLGTLTAYLLILVFIPGNKETPWDEQISTIHTILHQD